MTNRKTRLRHRLRGVVDWSQRHLPCGIRLLIGTLLLILGLFGFLPILGFWMIPLGLALIALDIPPLRRRLRHWLDRRHDAR